MKFRSLLTKKVIISLLVLIGVIGFIYWNDSRVPKRTFTDTVVNNVSAREINKMIFNADELICLKPLEGFSGSGRAYLERTGSLQVFVELGTAQIGKDIKEKIGSNLLSTPNAFSSEDIGNISLSPALTGTNDTGERFGIDLGRMSCYPDENGDPVCQTYVSIENPTDDTTMLGINVTTLEGTTPAFEVDNENSECG